MFPLTNKEPYIKPSGERTTLGDMFAQAGGDISELEQEVDELKELTDAKANKSDLASISITGTTNSTGSTIASGTYFYLNGALVKAKTDIANGATLTANTNYEAVTAGGLNGVISDLTTTHISTISAQDNAHLSANAYFGYCGNTASIILDGLKDCPASAETLICTLPKPPAFKHIFKVHDNANGDYRFRLDTDSKLYIYVYNLGNLSNMTQSFVYITN